MPKVIIKGHNFAGYPWVLLLQTKSLVWVDIDPLLQERGIFITSTGLSVKISKTLVVSKLVQYLEKIPRECFLHHVSNMNGKPLFFFFLVLCYVRSPDDFL